MPPSVLKPKWHLINIANSMHFSDEQGKLWVMDIVSLTFRFGFYAAADLESGNKCCKFGIKRSL